MALGNNSTAIFLGIANGKIVRRFREATANSVSRVNKLGATVHEEFYAFVEGYITGIEVREHEQYGKTWNVTLADDHDTYVLQMDYSGGYSSAFLKALPNVDFSQPVRLSPKMTIEGDKKKSTLFINQNGVAAKWAFTKDAPNGLPQLKKIKVKGKETWDDSDLMEFLENMVKTEIVPQLKSAKPAAKAEFAEALPFDVTEEDAPF